jgi:hypothetical protein
LSVKMQKIEGVVNEAHAALAIARGLRLRKARQATIADPAQLAVEVGRLHPYLRERGDHTRIFAAPVEPRPGQQLRPAALNPRRHAETVELNLMEPLRPGRGGCGQLSKLWRNPARKWGALLGRL